ncbi:methyltransferase domain-containing protein [Bacillus sp. REN3]|uniref:class I SAM-dependent methyltransferase n=1 Tax=Bacillus sp. REN3 TaxID=2802440 RepID=UPI001AEDF2AD|nr:methyltransferase domain-containing protein [Bacillus sp. REN3]
MDQKEKWNRKHAQRLSGKEELMPNPLLKKLVKNKGEGLAIDIACGLGANSLFLAEQGYEVTSLDLSEVAIRFVRKEAERRSLRIQAKAIDLEELAPISEEGKKYNLAIMTNYLDRSLFPVIKELLNTGGCFFMETFFMTEERSSQTIPDKYKLRSNELLEVFQEWKILFFEKNVQSGKQAIFCEKK